MGRPYAEESMATVGTNQGDFIFQSAEVTFLADGEKWKPDGNAIIDENDALFCIRGFFY